MYTPINNMDRWVFLGEPNDQFPTIHIISDSIGATGQAVARAAAASFGVYNPAMEVLSNVKNPAEMLDALDEMRAYHQVTEPGKPIILFYTLIEEDFRKAIEDYIVAYNDEIIPCDLMACPVAVIERIIGRKPGGKPGDLHSVNEYYFRRMDAMEFTINHDDGRNPQDLTKADIVLIGVSRSSKTPLSIYLSQQGYKVANVPIDFQSAPPKELFMVDPSRLFGLVISPETLADIRKRRLGNAYSVAANYADLEYVYQDLENARDLMRRLGAIVIRTDNRAIEETAQEILRYYENAHSKQNRFDEPV